MNWTRKFSGWKKIFGNVNRRERKMKLRRFEDAKQFDEEVKEYLLKQEALHNLQLGIIHTLIYHSLMYQSQAYLVSVEVEKDIVAVAMRTPPYPLLLSKIKDKAALEIIAQDLYAYWRSLPGVNAPTPEAQEFARVWCDISGQSYKLKMALRVFQLQQVKFVSQAPGYLRLATETERELIQSWYAAFYKEVGQLPRLEGRSL
jgi:predicted GNAT family acetyltransferase